MHQPGSASLTLQFVNRVIVLDPTSLVVNLVNSSTGLPCTARLNRAHPGQSQEQPAVAQASQPTSGAHPSPVTLPSPHQPCLLSRPSLSTISCHQHTCFRQLSHFHFAQRSLNQQPCPSSTFSSHQHTCFRQLPHFGSAQCRLPQEPT